MFFPKHELRVLTSRLKRKQSVRVCCKDYLINDFVQRDGCFDYEELIATDHVEQDWPFLGCELAALGCNWRMQTIKSV